MKEYQHNFSTISELHKNHYHDSSALEDMAKKMILICEDFRGNGLDDLRCLEIGCSTGYISEKLASRFGKVYAIDIDTEAMSFAHRKSRAGNIYYFLADSLNIPFLDRTFDVIICNSIYEHVPDANRLMGEIFRIMKENGCCYFGAGNRIGAVIEPHYHIPFLTWMPRWLAHKTMRALKKGENYYEEFLTYWGLLELTRNFKFKDYTIEVLTNPKKYFLDKKLKGTAFLSRIPRVILRILYPFIFPAYIWILTKKEGRIH